MTDLLNDKSPIIEGSAISKFPFCSFSEIILAAIFIKCKNKFYRLPNKIDVMHKKTLHLEGFNYIGKT
jgi:hypothetical protein